MTFLEENRPEKHEQRAPQEGKERLPESFQIAIDGTVASGKGTAARTVAERLGYLYVDTGAMYRAAALLANTLNISPDDPASLVPELRTRTISLRAPNAGEQDGRLITVYLDDKDVSWAIRTKEISVLTPYIAGHDAVREELIPQQQRIAAAQNVVMEGRDITHKVLPNAQMKIFLDADPRVRAHRRFLELQSRGVITTEEEVLLDLLQRDERDYRQSLKKVPEAVEIDTTHLGADEVVERILGLVRAHPDTSLLDTTSLIR